MSVEYQHSILWRGEDPSKRRFQPQRDDTKRVARYRAGQVPKWAEANEDEDSGGDHVEKPRRFRKEAREKEKEKPLPVQRQPARVEDAAISRLKRLAAHEKEACDQPDNRLFRHRVVQEAQVLEAIEDSKKDEKLSLSLEEEEEAVLKLDDPIKLEVKEEGADDDTKPEDLQTSMRERAREIALLKRKQEEEEAKEELDEEEEDDVEAEEESDDDESDSDDDDDPRRGAMMKPVFVSKTQRETVKEKEALAKEEEEVEIKKVEKLKERKVESKAMLIDTIQRTEEEERAAEDATNDASDIELIDDDDEKDEAEEYEMWKLRELRRIKRDRLEREERDKELEEVERRRNMTEQEREEDNKRLDAMAPKKAEAKNFNFLQKYFHRGAHFQDKATDGSEPIYLRDVHEPLASEQYDKNLLPKAMQLRRGQFGKMSQVKHTHLTAEDTTDQTAAWAQSSQKPIQRYQEKMATAKGVNAFDRPSGASSSRR